MGVGSQRHAPAALPLGKSRYPLYRRLAGPPGRSGRIRKISPPTGIRFPERPARSESLYRLIYPGPSIIIIIILLFHLHPGPTLRISRATPLLLLHTIMEWTGTRLPLFCISGAGISRTRLCLQRHNWLTATCLCHSKPNLRLTDTFAICYSN